MTDFKRLLTVLAQGQVEFILVGGVAAATHGSARATYDIDVVYRRTLENLERLVSVLAPLKPYLRGAPPGLPFKLDVDTVRRGLNFTLTSSAGDIDLLGEVIGGGSFESLVGRSTELDVFGVKVRCVDLPTLIQLKRAAGRPKDFDALAELEALLEETRRK